MKLIRIVLFSVFLLPFIAQAEEAGTAKIITSMSKGAQCISPVHILRIDGREANVQRMGFDLEPGTHTMSGRALIDTSFCKTIGKSTGSEDTAPLEAEFEAGKTYWVGYDHKGENRNDWKYVIWKVEDQ